ncbi:MAG: GyrI-like domain-containing protein [Bacteroidota bacterium]
MDVRIVVLRPITIVGLRTMAKMSDVDAVLKLWQEFGPRRQEIGHQEGEESYSVMRHLGFGPPKETSNVERWAAVQVRHFNRIPQGLTAFDMPGGTYAKFYHRGPAKDFPETVAQFHSQWLPESEFSIDDRPHFEIIPADYPGPDSPDAVEEVYIPIK